MMYKFIGDSDHCYCYFQVFCSSVEHAIVKDSETLTESNETSEHVRTLIHLPYIVDREADKSVCDLKTSERQDDEMEAVSRTGDLCDRMTAISLNDACKTDLIVTALPDLIKHNDDASISVKNVCRGRSETDKELALVVKLSEAFEAKARIDLETRSKPCDQSVDCEGRGGRREGEENEESWSDESGSDEDELIGRSPSGGVPVRRGQGAPVTNHNHLGPTSYNQYTSGQAPSYSNHSLIVGPMAFIVA